MDNKQIIAELTKQAYQCFPYGLSSYDDAYSTSNEFIYLKQLSEKRRDLLKDSWEGLLTELKTFGQVHNWRVDNWTYDLNYYSFQVVIILLDTSAVLEDTVRLVLSISVISPYYAIYQSIYSPDSRAIHKDSWNAVSYKIPSSATDCVHMLMAVSKKYFDNYSALDEEVCQFPIYNLMSGGKGHNEALSSFGFDKPLTIYNLFFDQNFV